MPITAQKQRNEATEARVLILLKLSLSKLDCCKLILTIIFRRNYVENNGKK